MKKRIFPKESGRRSRRKRAALIFLFLFLGFVGLVYRSFVLHLIGDPKLEKIANSQYKTTLAEVPPRDNIYDAAGEELAVSVSAYSAAIRPQRLKNRKESLQKLAAIFKTPLSELDAKLNPAKKYVWLKRNLAPREKSALEDMNLDGVELVKGSKRFYPNREVASQILGAVGQDSEGLSGLELFYDRYLLGSADSGTAYRDAHGRMFETEETMEGQKNREPHHLHLTLRKNIQYATEKELSQSCEQHFAKSCTAIVMDPQNGQILAMASYPSFNANSYQSYDLGSWKNLAVTDTFEPGSTFKVILAASALERGAVNPDDLFDCEQGQLRIGNHIIHDHESFGSLSVRDIIKVSSNIGIYKVAKKLGRQSFGDLIRLFGFGQKSGIDYPGEVSGVVRPAKDWQEVEFANAAFGQGIQVTAIQLTSAFAAIANGGIRHRPYLVSSITDMEGGALLETKPQAVERVLSPKTAQVMTDIMKEVATPRGTAPLAALPGYTVAGKTGTAQKVINGHYSHTKFTSSFVGMVPADAPRVVILVVVDEPQGQTYGGLVAAPIFRNIAWASLVDLGVPPEKSNTQSTPDVRQASAAWLFATDQGLKKDR